MTTPVKTLIEWFKNKKKPNETQFAAWILSYWHKDEQIPIGHIEGANEILVSKADKQALDTAVTYFTELINSIETGAVIDDTAETGANKTYSIDKIRELIRELWLEFEYLESILEQKQDIVEGEDPYQAYTDSVNNN